MKPGRTKNIADAEIVFLRPHAVIYAGVPFVAVTDRVNLRHGTIHKQTEDCEDHAGADVSAQLRSLHICSGKNGERRGNLQSLVYYGSVTGGCLLMSWVRIY